MLSYYGIKKYINKFDLQFLKLEAILKVNCN